MQGDVSMTLKARPLKEGKKKASPKCGFASYDRYAPLSRSGSRYILATHRYSGIHARNASRKFIRSQPSTFLFPCVSVKRCKSLLLPLLLLLLLSSSSLHIAAAFFSSFLLFH